MIRNFIKDKIDNLDTKAIYIISIFVSLIFIIVSYIPYGIKGAEVILQGVGCSGITAGIMAIFIDIAQQKQQKKRISELRENYLWSLNVQLKHLFERIIWFEHVILEHDLDKDIDYYLSLDFVAEAHKWNYYKIDKLENVEDEIINKYDKEKWHDNEVISYDKVEKMFNIIGCASAKLQTEVDNLLNNEMYLVVNGIMTSKEIGDLYVCLRNHTQFLQVRGTNYSTALLFLLQAYKLVRSMGNYHEDNMYITWQLPKDTLQMVLEKRAERNNHFC